MENYISIDKQLSEISDYKIVKKGGVDLLGILMGVIGILLLVIPLTIQSLNLSRLNKLLIIGIMIIYLKKKGKKAQLNSIFV